MKRRATENNRGRGADAAAAPDQEQRDLILKELDRSILVEAAAGTGKTTCMVDRMIALLRTGKCADIRTLAAVTFTRKAAAELRSRFQVALEKAAGEASGVEKENLRRALAGIEQCFMGTIHSFCARLLRERPVEANVDMDFEELDEIDDGRLREEAWDDCVARLLGSDPEDLLGVLDALGLPLEDLEGGFGQFAQYPDIESWPAPPADAPMPDLSGVRRELLAYLAHVSRLAPMLPDEWGNDKLIPVMRRLSRAACYYRDLADPARMMELVRLFDRSVSIVQKQWTREGRLTAQQARDEKERWDVFRAEVIRPALRLWRERCYPAVLKMYFAARGRYDDLRAERGALNYQDLLMKAAALLRGSPHVRRYFRERFSHLLVDEFQDTDPIQAEVILLLAAGDPEETDWRRCAVRPGSLFVVGDPKQSIYRFRRADIVTYNEVKRIITGQGGKGPAVTLSANFRAAGEIIGWVNRVFGPPEEGPGARAAGAGPMLRFPGEATVQSPAYVALQKGRLDGSAGGLEGVYRLTLPPEMKNQEAYVEYEADRIAGFIRHAIDSGLKIQRTRGQLEEGTPQEAGPADFMIITRKTAHLGTYGRKLQEYAVPHQVTGGTALNEVEELKLLHVCLEAVVRPDDPVALLAALRSPLFGVSDRALYAFKKAGGAFSYHSAVPGGLPESASLPLIDAFSRLKRCSLLLSRLPPVAAFEEIALDCGLVVRAAARPGGDVSAGSLAKALEILRVAQAGAWTSLELVEHLGQLVDAREKHDGLSARSRDEPCVRVMNLHKVKGLEAAVVFLACPLGEDAHEAEVHIDRSRGGVVGHMAVYGAAASAWGQRPMLAQPADWEALQGKESLFLEAEELRLRYVAATRAAAALVITQRPGSNAKNYWQHFAGFIPEDRELPAVKGCGRPVKKRITIQDGDPGKAGKAIGDRLRRAGESTHEIHMAKAYALAMAGEATQTRRAPGQEAIESPGAPPVEGESGTEWGSVIHLLLQIAMTDPQAELSALASSALAEKDLDPGLAPQAVNLVHGVMRSKIWQRASGSEQRFTELPFELLLDDEAARRKPTILRGAIDLVFKEAAGWVLVDYKTDAAAGSRLEALTEKYSPQIRLYASVWEKATGEKVTETLLYFLRPDAIVSCG